jgi:hypothetical protein
MGLWLQQKCGFQRAVRIVLSFHQRGKMLLSGSLSQPSLTLMLNITLYKVIAKIIQ